MASSEQVHVILRKYTKKMVGVAFLFPLKEKKLNQLIGSNSLI